MKNISRNKQKDTRPLAGLLGLKQMLFVPVSVFVFIFSTVNLLVPTAF